ncbi:MAG: hypothetical protein AAGF31_08180 [Planctomycetota bacterium]
MQSSMSMPSNETATGVVNVYCPHCGTAHPVREQVLGRLAKCTHCEQRFVLRRPGKNAAENSAEESTESHAAATPIAAATVESSNEAAAVSPPMRATRIDPPQPPPFVAPTATADSDAAQSPPPLAATALPSTQQAGLPELPRPRAAKILGIVAIMLEVSAAICLVGGLFWATIVLLSLLSASDTAVAAMVLAASGVIVIQAVIGSAALVIFAQLIRLAVHIEKNTRLAADASRAAANQGGKAVDVVGR